jgi:hypothetical protein
LAAVLLVVGCLYLTGIESFSDLSGYAGDLRQMQKRSWTTWTQQFVALVSTTAGTHGQDKREVQTDASAEQPKKMRRAPIPTVLSEPSSLSGGPITASSTGQPFAPPLFVNFPPNITLACNVSPQPALTGVPVARASAKSNCDSTQDLVVTYADFIRPAGTGACGGWLLERQWSAQDCDGISTTAVQVIRLVSTVPPVWTYFPADASVGFLEPFGPIASGLTPVANKLVTAADQVSDAPVGQVPMAVDSCGNTAVTIVFRDLVTGQCQGDRLIERTWTVTDSCQNTAQRIQLVSLLASRMATANINPSGGADPSAGKNLTVQRPVPLLGLASYFALFSLESLNLLNSDVAGAIGSVGPIDRTSVHVHSYFSGVAGSPAQTLPESDCVPPKFSALPVGGQGAYFVNMFRDTGLVTGELLPKALVVSGAQISLAQSATTGQSANTSLLTSADVWDTVLAFNDIVESAFTADWNAGWNLNWTCRSPDQASPPPSSLGLGSYRTSACLQNSWNVSSPVFVQTLPQVKNIPFLGGQTHVVDVVISGTANAPLSLVGSDPLYNLFDLTPDVIDTTNKSTRITLGTLQIDCPASSIVIIRLALPEVQDVVLAWSKMVALNGLPFSAILFTFPTASSLTLIAASQSAQWLGSIYAPYAALRTTGLSIMGQIIVGQVGSGMPVSGLKGQCVGFQGFKVCGQR